jgi:hypothetical protein
VVTLERYVDVKTNQLNLLKNLKRKLKRKRWKMKLNQLKKLKMNMKKIS